MATHFLDSGLFDPSTEPEPEQPVFEGLVYQGDVVVWVGCEKHRKSNLVLQAAICGALGCAFLHFAHGTGKPMRVVYVDYESKRQSFHRRYKAICAALSLTEEKCRVLRENLHVILVRELRRQRQPVPRFPVRVKSSDDKEANKWWKRFANEYPADLYVFDPMRCLHGQDENDSTIETLLSQLHEVFPDATLIIPHHMNKASAGVTDSTGSNVSLATPGNLRAFANGARGSSAINAHADAVICQERRIESDVETVYLGGYMKDSADVEPIALVESNHESFFWVPSASVPERLRKSFEALRAGNGPFKNEADAVSVLIGSNVTRSTAYRHVKQLRDGGFLICGVDGCLAVRVSGEPRP